MGSSEVKEVEEVQGSGLDKKRRGKGKAIERTKYEKYEIVEIDREQLTNAPYNPRNISPAARRKLRENIEKRGLIEPIVWNERTGNIVSGHQRVKILDSLEGTHKYRLRVAKVDLDEKVEKEQNVFMNNPESQGTFEIEKLDGMMKDAGLDVANMGFDQADVFKYLGGARFADGRAAELVELSSKMREAIKSFEQARDKSADRNETEFYLVVVFKDREHRKKITDALGVEDNRYLDGRVLEGALRLPD
jgi:hypothetical protein